MGRTRSRSRTRSYSPRRSSAKRYDEPRDNRSRRDRRSPAPSGLLIRNISLASRPEDLRIPFERFGPIKDVYLPKDYYTGEPRGFGFVKFRYGEDAAEAKQQLNHTVIGGREIRIVFAEENRKTPQEMRRVPHTSDRGSHRRRSPPRSPVRRHGSHSRSPSPSPARSDLRRERGAKDGRSSRRSRSVSRSVSPRDDDRGHKKNQRSPRRSRSASQSRSPRGEKGYRSPGPGENNGQSPHYERDSKPSRSRSPKGDIKSPSRSRSPSHSPR